MPRLSIATERHPISGAWVVSTIIDGRLVSHAYYGHTKKEATRLFRELHAIGLRDLRSGAAK